MEKTTKEKIDELREKIQWKLDVIGQSNALYIPKCVYIPKGKLAKYVTFWENELRQNKDIYITKASRDFVSEDPNFTLYKWVFNPYYNEEYEYEIFSSTGDRRFFIPFNELHEVKIEPVVEEKKGLSKEAIAAMIEPTPIDTTTYKIESKVKDLSVKDFIAIMHLKPISDDKILNDFIKAIKQS